MPIPLFFVAGAAVSKLATIAIGAAAVSGAGNLAVSAYKAYQESGTSPDTSTGSGDNASSEREANQEALVRQAAEMLRCFHKQYGVQDTVSDEELHRQIKNAVSGGGWSSALIPPLESLPKHRTLMAQCEKLDGEIEALHQKRLWLSEL